MTLEQVVVVVWVIGGGLADMIVSRVIENV